MRLASFKHAERKKGEREDMKLSSKSYSKSLWTSIVAMLLIISALVPLIAEAEINSTGTYFWVDPQENIVKSVSTLFSVDIMIENAPTT